MATLLIVSGKFSPSKVMCEKPISEAGHPVGELDLEALGALLQGWNGEIEIVECSWDGTRVYFEEGVRQSQATPDGESVFTYVKLMDELLYKSENILVLGRGGGNLATRLSRLGKAIDHRRKH